MVGSFLARRSVAEIGALSVVLVGCDRGLAECPDAACRVQRAEAAFRDAPLDTLQAISALPDPLEQAALIEALVYAFPRQSGAICASAPAGSMASTRCQQRSLRPHLYTDAGLSAAPRLVRAAPGPARALPSPVDRPPPWVGAGLDEAALRGACGASSTCLADAALARAATGEAAAAGQLCLLAWPEGSVVRDECVFQIAERLVLTGGGAQVGPALAACAGAGVLSENCTQHVVLLSLPPAPPADRVDRPSLAALQAQLARIEAAGSPALTASLVDLAWSAWTRDAVGLAAAPSGRLLAAVPPEAAPHVRMAEAWRYAQLHPDVAEGLRDGQVELQASLGSGGAPLEEPVPLPPPRPNPAQPLAWWRFDRDASDGAMPSVHALGAGRRTVSTDPELDLQIALLEAYARVPGASLGPLLRAKLGSDDAFELRWTAARLAVELEPRAAPGLMGLDPDPRVEQAVRAGRVVGLKPGDPAP